MSLLKRATLKRASLFLFLMSQARLAASYCLAKVKHDRRAFSLKLQVRRPDGRAQSVARSQKWWHCVASLTVYLAAFCFTFSFLSCYVVCTVVLAASKSYAAELQLLFNSTYLARLTCLPGAMLVASARN